MVGLIAALRWFIADHDPSVLYNLHKNHPIVPNVREALQDLEHHASDEYVTDILNQVTDKSSSLFYFTVPISFCNLQYKPNRGWMVVETMARDHCTASLDQNIPPHMALLYLVCVILGCERF